MVSQGRKLNISIECFASNEAIYFDHGYIFSGVTYHVGMPWTRLPKIQSRKFSLEVFMTKIFVKFSFWRNSVICNFGDFYAPGLLYVSTMYDNSCIHGIIAPVILLLPAILLYVPYRESCTPTSWRHSCWVYLVENSCTQCQALNHSVISQSWNTHSY